MLKSMYDVSVLWLFVDQMTNWKKEGAVGEREDSRVDP
jgi:hypothetical protein